MNKTKIFFDIEKETKWLNSLASQGCRLTAKQGFTYSFKPCKDGQYLYQVERRRPFSTKENKDYMDFASSLDINIVSTQFGWFYFEKENDGKEFNIFTDVPSKISHYKNLIITLLIIGLLNFSILNSNPRGPYIFNISFPFVANSIMLIAIVVTIVKYLLKIHNLKKEKSIIE